MSRENLLMVCGILFLVALIFSALNNKNVQDTAPDTFHEIGASDLSPVAFAPCPIPAGAQGVVPGQGQVLQPGAMAAAVAGAGAPAIELGQAKPELVKIMGVEAIEVGSGKVKITGVMGSSWAAKAGLEPGDILLSFNTKDITSFEQFKILLASLPPEKDYKFTYLRGASKKKGIIWVGEGEMEGFLPIPTPK
ncbi:MAG: PDZ domain-containing protein [Candidatus Omnitrophica bacterium]|nr:PDZ domain-containing protein [Candidatus Omnitrophota bacterium]